jgi:hypothetical protein
MGLLARLLENFGRGRERGMLADDTPEPGETPHLPRPVPTAGTHIPKRPDPTPTTGRMQRVGDTAGTPSYRSPSGTPSTQRIHNPSHPGR